MSKNSFVEQHYGIARVEIVEVGEEDSDEYDEEDLGIAMRRDEHINMESIQRIINGVVPPRQEDEAEEEEDEEADKNENMENEECAPDLNSEKQVSNLESICDEKRLPPEEKEIYYETVNAEEKESTSKEEQFKDFLDIETPKANLSTEGNKKCHVISDEGNVTYKEMEEGSPDDRADQTHLAEQLSTEEDEEQCAEISDNISDEENLMILSTSSSTDENESGCSCYGDEEMSESSIEETHDTAGNVQLSDYQSDVKAVGNVEIFEDIKKFSDEKAKSLKLDSATLAEEKTIHDVDPKPGVLLDKIFLANEEDSIDKKDPSVKPDKKDPSVKPAKKDSSVEADKKDFLTEPRKNAEEQSALEKDETIQWKEVDDRLPSQPMQTSEHSSSLDEVQSIDKDIDLDTEDSSGKQTLQKVPVDRMGCVKRKIIRKVRKSKKTLESLLKEQSATIATENDNSNSEEETDLSTKIRCFKKFRRRHYNSELSHPRYRKPLELGWVRELVYRNMNSNKRTRFADVYYYTPKGRKLRSSVQVKQFLTPGLTLKNFTFAKESLGINDNVREIVRSARISLRSKIIDSHKRALANTRRIKELKRYLKSTIFPSKKKASFLSLHSWKAKKGKLSDELERDSETKHSNDEYSDDDDFEVNIIKSYTCTQKCPKALHFIPTIKCINCEMKFHPQCEEIPLDDASDIEDVTPIVDYDCRKCALLRHRNAGEPLRQFLTPTSSPPPIILPPPTAPAVFQLVFPLPEKTLTATLATQLAGINQQVNFQQHPVDKQVNINSSTETEDLEQLLSPVSVTASGMECDEDSIEGSEADEMQNIDAIYAENNSLISDKNEGNEPEVVNEDLVSFNEQDGRVLLLAGAENNLNVQDFESGQQYIISQIHPEIVGEDLVNSSESNFSFVINEGESNHAIQQQVNAVMEELISPQVEPQSVSLASAKENEGGQPTNIQFIEKDEEISAAVANIADENSSMSLKATQQEESNTPNDVQLLEGISDSENSRDQTKVLESKKEDEVIRKKARNMKPRCNCLPSKTTDLYKCNIFSEQERAVIYHKFWKNLSWKRKKKFVDGLVEKPIRTGDKRNGEDSCIFFLEKSGQRFRVCRKMFLNTLGIGEWSLNNWLKNIHDGYKPKKYWNDLILR